MSEMAFFIVLKDKFHYTHRIMKIIAKNKRAYFDYDIEQTREAGIILQ